MIRFRVTITFLLIFFCSFISGQSLSERRNIAKENLDSLKNGYLLVRIEDYHNDIEEASLKGKSAIVEELTDLSELEIQNYLSHFSNNYSFSKHYFYFARDANKLILENDHTVLFDGKGNQVKTILEGPIFLCFKEKRRWNVLTFRRDFHIYKLVNKKRVLLPKPFPSEAKLPPVKPFFAIWKKLKFNEEVKYLNKTLEANYEFWVK